MAKKSIYLFITTDFPPMHGGQANHLFNLWKSLPEGNSIILAPKVKKDYVDHLKTIKRVNIPLGYSKIQKIIKVFIFVKEIFKLSFKYKIKCIHFGQVFAGGFAGLLCYYFRRIPYIVYVHGVGILSMKKSLFFKRRLKKILKKAQMVIVNSGFSKDLVNSFVKLPDENIKIIHPAVNVKKFSRNMHTEKLRKKLNLANKKIILTVSRIIEKRGHDYIIENLPNIIKKIPNLSYIIVGTGPYEDKLKKLVSKNNLSEHVKFVGFVSDHNLPSYYALCDLYVTVGREIHAKGGMEGFGITFIEAGLAGKASVAGNIGGTEDAVKHEQTGLIVDPNDKEKISQAIIDLLSDDQKRNEMGKKAKERAEQHFDADVRSKEFVEKFVNKFN